jgi:hypothetical protein
MWPTPAARDHKDTGKNTNYEKVAKKHKLAGAVKMWPTPNAGLEKHSDKAEYWENRVKKGRQTDIQMEVYKQTGSGQLNAEWVTWLMGYPPGYLTLDPSGT